MHTCIHVYSTVNLDILVLLYCILMSGLADIFIHVHLIKITVGFGEINEINGEITLCAQVVYLCSMICARRNQKLVNCWCFY